MKNKTNRQLGELQKKLHAAESKLKKHHATLGALPAKHGYDSMAAFIAALGTVAFTPVKKKAAKKKQPAPAARKSAAPKRKATVTAKPKATKKKS